MFKSRAFISMVALLVFAASLPVPGAQAIEEPRISVDFKDASLKDVLKVFSQQSGQNFIASQGVQDQMVTLYLDNVAAKDALDQIVKANNLRYEQDNASNIIVIYPSQGATPVVTTGVVTKVFPVKYSRLTGSSLGVGGDGVINELSTSSNVSGTTGGGAQAAARNGLDTIVASFLSPQGRVTVDLRTNSLVVADTADRVAVIEDILKGIDVPSKQVMIEVHIMEVRASFIEDIGVSYGGAEGELLSFAGGTKSTSFPFNDRLSPTFNSNPKVPTLTTALDTINDTSGLVTPSITLGTLSASNLSATLRLLIDERDTKILARPRVLTMNNEAAEIRLITNTSIANTSTTSSSGGALGATTNNVAERSETGIILRMTPQINFDNSVELFIEPSVTTASVSTFFPAAFLDPTTRSVRTTVRVNDGETLVIGGLIDKDLSSGVRKVPVLGDLPLVGDAFRYREKDNFDRELLIFLTPHIVNGPQPVEPLSPKFKVQAGIRSLLQKSAAEKSFKERDVTSTFKEAEIRRTLETLRRNKK